MGTWGAGGFENDEAADFISEVSSAEDLAAVFGALPDDPSAEKDADLAQRVVAAAECIAAMLGRPADDMPDTLAKRVSSFGRPEPDLLEAAREAVSSILMRSELLDLWAEEDSAAFNLSIHSLIDRLNPGQPAKAKKKKRKKETLQTCGFCDQEIDPDELVSIEISQQADEVNFLSRGFWCHLRCLNTHLHPRHIVQNWKYDAEEIDREVDRLLDQ